MLSIIRRLHKKEPAFDGRIRHPGLLRAISHFLDLYSHDIECSKLIAGKLIQK